MKVSNNTNTHAQTAAPAANDNKQANNKPAETKPASNSPAAEFTRSKNPVDRAAIDRLLRESDNQAQMFEKLVSSVFNKQGRNFAKAWGAAEKSGNLKSLFQNLNVDAATRDKAREMVSDDGYFGVKQTSERLLSFAKAYAGDDPAKIAEMRSAFEKGFKAAEKAWGGKLPEISYKTHEAVMKGFDEMEANARKA
ncbi:MAG: hypothetical protein FWE91_02300 [Defluviitaleaceae bacterium]|nr:hypothetical protein [Defluviitaleaceae bacterium]MCL2835138.1 hypothetical protein [Defluviitaleaceae bacterium]